MLGPLLLRRPCGNYVESNFLLNVWESSVDDNIYFCKKDVTSGRSVIRCYVNCDKDWDTILTQLPPYMFFVDNRE